MSVIEVHAAERGVQHAVAEGKTERARPDFEMKDAGLAHIEIDVGVEGGGRGRLRRHGSGGSGLRSRTCGFGRGGLGRGAGLGFLRARTCAPVRFRLGEPVFRSLTVSRRATLGPGCRAWLGRRRLAVRLLRLRPRRKKWIEVEIVERQRRPDMRSRRAKGDHRLPLAARVLERKAGVAEGDLVVLPGDMAGKLAIADAGGGGRFLPHPGEERRNRVGLGGQFALPGQARPGQQAAIEARGERRSVQSKHQSRRALLAEVGDGGQLETEVDRLLFPVELARSGEGRGERRQAESSGDVFDAPRGTFLVVNDVDGAVLDPHVPELDVAAGLGAGICGFGRFGLLWLPVVIAEAQRHHRPLQHDALGIDVTAHQLHQTDIDDQSRHGEVRRARARLGIDKGRVGDDDMGTRGKEERSRAIDCEFSPRLLLDAIGHALADPIRRNEEIDGNEDEQGRADNRSGNDQQEPGAPVHGRLRGALWRRRVSMLLRRRCGGLVAVHGPRDRGLGL